MLGKLIKYEFRATVRYFLPIYAALIFVSLLSGLVSAFSRQDMDMLQLIFVLSYMLLAMALAVITLVVLVSRFYRNLLCNEGYLMFTLPVTASENILAKLIPAFVWLVGSIVLVCFCLVLLVDWNAFIELFYAIDLSMIHWSWEAVLSMVSFFLTLAFLAASSILFAYMCMAIGQRFNEHKFLASVGVYLVLSMALQVAGVIFLFTVGSIESGPIVWLFRVLTQASESVQVVFVCLAFVGGSFLCCLIPYLITRWQLSKHLNLA